MNKAEFLEKCKETFDDLEKKYNYEVRFYFKPYGDDDTPLIRIEIGGVSGGSCWDNSNPKPYTCDYINVDTDFIYDILLEVDKNIPFLICRNIKKECVTESINTEYEYYGNCTQYRDIKIDFEKMADILIKNGIIFR